MTRDLIGYILRLRFLYRLHIAALDTVSLVWAPWTGELLEILDKFNMLLGH